MAEEHNRIDDAWRGSLYLEHTSHHRRHDPPFLDAIVLKPGTALLDLGCGDGAVTASLADRFPEAFVTGIDAAPDMIASAQRHSGPNLRFECRRIQDLDFIEEFDVVVSIAALHWTPGRDQPSILSKIYGALRRRGQFLAEFGGAGNVQATIACANSIAMSGGYAPKIGRVGQPWYFPTPGDYKKLAEGAGFRHVTTELITQDRVFSEEEFEGWLVSQTLLPWTVHLDAATAIQFTDEVVSAASTRARDGDIYRERFHRVRLAAGKP
jgi:trans-aconitate 2-methyltransferase